MVKVLYTAHGHATGGGREGSAQTDDKVVDLKLTTPKALGGAGNPGTNPEQLFAVGYSACFLGAMRFVGGRDKIPVPADAKVETAVGIGPREDGEGFGITADLTITLPGLNREQAEELVRRADIVCPYSHATQGNMQKTLTVA
ncbi:MAG: osmotically inducible protein OsmC [Enterovirga sp.]|jgi:osmotically inducible protein OsmC|nr:osmotically inducible protein OsmC [Enterovirga sp.]